LSNPGDVGPDQAWSSEVGGKTWENMRILKNNYGNHMGKISEHMENYGKYWE
jgi:hypothetical protein